MCIGACTWVHVITWVYVDVYKCTYMCMSVYIIMCTGTCIRVWVCMSVYMICSTVCIWDMAMHDSLKVYYAMTALVYMIWV